jgi:hypothetical protein
MKQFLASVLVLSMFSLGIVGCAEKSSTTSETEVSTPDGTATVVGQQQVGFDAQQQGRSRGQQQSDANDQQIGRFRDEKQSGSNGQQQGASKDEKQSGSKDEKHDGSKGQNQSGTGDQKQVTPQNQSTDDSKKKDKN